MEDNFNELENGGQIVDESVVRGETIKQPLRENAMGALLRDQSRLMSEIETAEITQGMPRVPKEGSPAADRIHQLARESAGARSKLLGEPVQQLSGTAQAPVAAIRRGAKVYHTIKRVKCVVLDAPVNGRVTCLNLITDKEFRANVENLVTM